MTPKLDEEQLYNGETDDTDGPQSPEGAGVSPQDVNASHPLHKDQIKQLGATHAGHRDDLALLQSLVPNSPGEQRPQSLAVPWMTTANSLQQKPPSPVMTMSPQAAYMSKIIPNAVLPPSIDVVEISRGRSRNSVRTVSKASLLLSSPAPSRASSRASTVYSSSSHNPQNLSYSSCWSNSDSSETLVSDSSTISSSSTPRQKRSQDGDGTAKGTSNGKVVVKGDAVKKDGPFVRSLSVIKSKRAPPPPNRSYSLHNKMKRRSRDLVEVDLHSIPVEENEKNKCGSPPALSRTIDSPGYNADTSSLEDSPVSVSLRPQLQTLKAGEAAKVEEPVSKDALQEHKLSKMASPSSGYSSQDGASAPLSRQTRSSSPKHKKGILAKLQRFFPGSAHAAPVLRPATLPEAPEITKPTALKPTALVSTVSVNPSVRALIELFNIPPPPKVHAPPPPPPEVWAHSKRSFELLLGPPAPDNVYAIIKKNPKDRRQHRKSPSVSTDGSVKGLVVERKQKSVTAESMNGSVHVLETKGDESVIVNAEIHKENDGRLAEQNVGLEGKRKVTEVGEKVRVSDLLNGMLVKAVERREERLAEGRKDKLPAISIVPIPPSPSPPPVHSPPHPPTVVSPELSWPPPPPPVGLGGPDVLDFPLPPPPVFGDEGLVIPVQVPAGDPSCTTTSVLSAVTECVGATTEAEPQTSDTPQGTVAPVLNIPPPPSYTAPPPPLKVVSSPMMKNVSPHLSKRISPMPTLQEVSLPPPEEASVPPPKEVSPQLVREAPPVSSTLVTVVSPPPSIEVSPPKQVSTLPAEEVRPPSVPENGHPSSEDATPVDKLAPPQSIPPSPPQSPVIDLPEENIPAEANPGSSNSILIPPQSIPPPPPIQLPHQPQGAAPVTAGPVTQEASHSPPSEVSVQPVLENSLPPEKAPEPVPPPPPVNIPLPPPLPVQGLTAIKHEPSPASTEKQTPEPASAPAVQEDFTPIVTPSLLKMVKLRSVNSSPEPPKAQEEPEVIMRNHQPSGQVPTSSSSAEAPQKPIRKSLIITTTSTSPTSIVASQQAFPSSQPLVVPPLSPSSTNKSPSAMTASPSMNLQEAIRLRTAARSLGGPAPRLGLHSPPSPADIHKSTSSTASFIFSKSNRKVVTETKPVVEIKATTPNSPGVSSLMKVVGEAELVQKGVKVPPPVAKKPKTKGKETSEGAAQTAGQEELQDGGMGRRIYPLRI